MKHASGEAFVLWIDRATSGELMGVMENVADSTRHPFESLEELGRLLAEALDDAHLQECETDELA